MKIVAVTCSLKNTSGYINKGKAVVKTQSTVAFLKSSLFRDEKGFQKGLLLNWGFRMRSASGRCGDSKKQLPAEV